jgi:hypothetical protein
VLVCPNCRGENLEEARFCQRCGRSLEPQAASLRGGPAKEVPEEDLDVSPPKPPSAWPGITALVLVVMALGGWALWYLLKPDPCQNKYSSVLFSYCAEIPEGWEGGSQLAAEGNLDQFSPPAEDAATFVRVQDISPSATTDTYAQDFRTNQEADGLSPSRMEAVEIDGEQALAWDVTVPSEDGETLRLREVVVVREDGGWRITLAATDQTYQDARIAFEEMLDSWHWK